MATKAMIPLLVGMMLLTGMCNTLFTKYQDMQCVANCDNPDPRKHKTFEQPVIQTLQMFLGECGCWLVVFASFIYRKYISRSSTITLQDTAYEPVNADDETDLLTRRPIEDEEIDPSDAHFKPFVDAEIEGAPRIPLKGWKLILLALPACCDIAGTTLMNVGLLFVAASIYQMTRGALVLFVGLFSVIFLKKHLSASKWASLFVVVLGVAVVGLAGALEKKIPQVPGKDEGNRSAVHIATRLIRDVVVAAKETSPAQTVVGIFLIAGAQIFTASQFVLEENIMAKYELDPLATVGWEGLFGFLVTAFAMLILHFTVGITEAGRGGYFDAKEGLSQVFNNRAIAISGLLTMISIGGFNFFGLSVTRTVSATSRSTIDTCRTLFIWVVSLGLGWETFKWLQVVGFALLVYGTMVFNEIVRPPTLRFLQRKQSVALDDETRAQRSSTEGR
ncbi:putative nucleotide-sugar transporter [Delphinella strobiligena]|nr:putative nucleotide-sugar transporter [Delphinella strobiligena]